MNPFLKETYKNFILDQVEGLNIECSKIIDLGEKEISAARQILHYERNSTKRIFSTKKDSDGNYWVKRIK